MKHGKKTMYNHSTPVDPGRNISVAGEISSMKSVKKAHLLIHHCVDLARMVHVVWAGHEGFEMANGKIHFFVVDIGPLPQAY